MIKKLFPLLIVIVAGEAIFMHPFLVPRLYRSLMMEAWDLTNTDVGLAFSAYGITAMVSYLLGGPFADKYEPRGLIVISLLATALGSGLLFLHPSAAMLVFTYGIFGISTIFLMWSAMIKVTHEIGGEESRATAMGFLEGGRGLIAAAMASFLVFLVESEVNSVGEITEGEDALKLIYGCLSIFMIVVSVMVWFGLKNVENKESSIHDWSFEKAKVAAKDLNLWMLSIIILCAYCGYKNIGNYPVYMKDVKGMSILASSKFTSYIFWARPISAFIAGILTDKLALKIKGGRFITLIICFILGGLSQLLLALDILQNFSIILSAIIFGSCFMFALRALYFSVFGDFKIHESIVGTAVGIVSLVGYLPDFFFGAFTGYLIDSYPDQFGFSMVFGFTGALFFLGAVASYICYKRVRH